jgi:NACalpha-BTF3-like transcription factor
VVEAGNSDERLGEVAREARERAIMQRVESPETRMHGAFEKLFSTEHGEGAEGQGQTSRDDDNEVVQGVPAGCRDGDTHPDARASQGAVAVGLVVPGTDGSLGSCPSPSQSQGGETAAAAAGSAAASSSSSARVSSSRGSFAGGFFGSTAPAAAAAAAARANRGGARQQPQQQRQLQQHTTPDKIIVERLVSMGFGKKAASDALAETRNDCARAIEMLTAVDGELASQMEGLGFETERVRKALFKSNNDPVVALEMLTGRGGKCGV